MLAMVAGLCDLSGRGEAITMCNTLGNTDELNLMKTHQVNKRSHWFLFSGPFLFKQRYRYSRVLARLSRLPY
jgi:hypothetical protein